MGYFIFFCFFVTSKIFRGNARGNKFLKKQKR